MTSQEIAAVLPSATRVIEEGIGAGLHRGVALFVSLDGETLVDGGIGTGASGRELTAETLLPWLSAGKPLTAVAVMQQVERGEIDLDDPVTRFLPEFGQNGKEGVAVRNLLTHTAGIQPVTPGWPDQPWEAIIDRICRARLRHGWTDRQAAYDPLRSWFILGEIVRCIDGRMIDVFVRQEICEPLGMVDTWMALSSDRPASLGHRLETLEESVDGVLRNNDPRVPISDIPSPGSSNRGPAHDLGRFYEMLRQQGTLDGTTILQPDTVAELTRRQRTGLFDASFQHTVDFGLGVIVDSNRYGADTVPYGFGRHSSARAFGHGGSQSSIGFTDPERGLVVVAIANGCPGETLHNERNRRINTAIYEDLGLARPSR